MKFVFLASTAVVAQQVGTQTGESHPRISTSTCTASGCQTESSEVVLDANWRWLHDVSDTTNCYTGDEWDKNLCPDPQTCATKCGVDGADYPGTYGITGSGESVKLNFVTKGPYSTNVGSRTYLGDSSGEKYKMFMLKNREFTFDVDVSQLACGLNGALYFVQMDADGGVSKYPADKAGAKYGTGYCDAQCPHDIKFINGEANLLDWTPSPTDKNSGTGKYGSCCTEMDIWEANSISSAYTPHVCKTDGQYRCEGVECGDADDRYNGVCDKDGCDFNAFRNGNTTFFGPGSSFALDSTKPMTVVTQFITSDGTDNGDLTEIKRVYVQNGKVVPQSMSSVKSFDKQYNSVSDDYCNSQKTAFGDKNDFQAKGGLKAMGDSMEKGMVLVMSLWDDYAVHMLWLDSTYPPTKPTTDPGVARGTCSVDSGNPTDVEANHPDASVTYSNIKVGTIGSTYPH